MWGENPNVTTQRYCTDVLPGASSYAKSLIGEIWPFFDFGGYFSRTSEYFCCEFYLFVLIRALRFRWILHLP